MKRIAVFASGTGTNFEAIARAIEEGRLAAKIALVVVDQPQAAIIEKAQKRAIETFVFRARDYADKAAYEREILTRCQAAGVEWIVLAGYMRILSDLLLEAYPNKIINIHPSLLPAFKGKDAIGQAIAYGVKVMGVSIHYVNRDLDGGRIIAQQAFAVQEGWTHEEIEQQVHAIEHELYPNTLKMILEKESRGQEE